MTVAAFDDRAAFDAQHRRLLDRLYRQADAARWPLAPERFDRALYESAARHFQAGGASAADVATYLEGLNAADLALAAACRDGVDRAWEHFVAEFRPKLQAAARAIAGPDDGRELADSIYAELYGLEERGGERRSLFAYFHGRSSLATWLRSVLAQRHVDGLRRSARMRPLDDAPASRLVAADANPAGGDAVKWLPMARAAVDRAIAALSDDDRLRLSYYYAHQLTLAQIGTIMGEHESTVSRKLERARQRIRKDAEKTLRRDHRLGDAEVRACREALLSEDGT